MTGASKRDLLLALRPRYRHADKAEKGRILEQFVVATGYHRKYAITLLKHGPLRPRSRSRVGHTRYGAAVVAALTTLWKQSGQLCGKRLHAFVPLWLAALERTGELSLTPEVKVALLHISPATIDRKLRAARRLTRRRGLSTTRAGNLLKHQIPVRTFADWNEARPGFTEIDLVAHCGDSAGGEFVHTLNLVDVATGWSEFRAVLNRGQRAVFAALQVERGRLPFPLLGIDSDNDGAFINAHLLRYCEAEHLTFTRSRSYKKNDQAHIEQKNGSTIRRTVGYDRYEGEPATHTLNAFYDVFRLWVNFFQPSMKLVEKHRLGSTVRKKYDQPQTPYQRVLASPEVSDEDKQVLHDIFRSLNPLALRRELDRRLEVVWRLAVR